jgi:hypothetical protein
MSHAFNICGGSEGIVSCPDLGSEQFYIFPCVHTFGSVQSGFGDYF